MILTFVLEGDFMKVLRIIAFAAALTMLTSTLVSMPVYAVEAPVATATTEEKQTYSGSCGAEGSNITWTLDAETDTLTFSGTGTIKTYDGPKVEKFENPAWNMYGVSINHIIVEEGITDIGSFTNSMFHSVWTVDVNEKTERLQFRKV